MMKSTCALVILGFTLASGALAQDISELVSECEACHGPAGVSNAEDVPSLAGKSVTYLARPPPTVMEIAPRRL